jgi:hypothetical protein
MGGSVAVGGASSGGSSTTTASATTATTCSGLPKDTCSVDEAFAVFVSPLGNDAGAGSETAPVASLRRALELAATPRNGRKRSVFVCASAGDFQQKDTLLVDASVDGVSIYGGFDCSDETAWILPANPTQSRILSASATAVKMLQLRGEIHLENLSITAADANYAVAPGSSSIALLIAESPNVQLSKVDLIAGRGAAGKAGANYAGVAPVVGKPGVDGAKACTSGVGAAEIQTLCEGAPAPSVGGKGGDGATLESVTGDKPGFNGENGKVAPEPNPDGKGAGGYGQVATSGCTSGADGLTGSNGDPAQGGKGPGALTLDGYLTADGKPGNAGKPGQGGGGGGGAKAPMACEFAASPTTPAHGASGGSGGTGGCGGRGGGAGQGGGASLALALINSGVTLRDCHLTANRGGNGGIGGPAQGGGAGGIGGRGADGYGSSSSPSCRGGEGGRGGAGSPGGGGAGGPSAAIGWVGTAATVMSSALKYSLEVAAGGADGNGSTVASGLQGATVEQLQL